MLRLWIKSRRLGKAIISSLIYIYISYETYLSYIIFIYMAMLTLNISCLVKVIITFVCGFIERLAWYSLSIGLSSRASCKHGAYTTLYL